MNFSEIMVYFNLSIAIGNNEANEGNYNEAIDYFTQAISLHNRDFRLVCAKLLHFIENGSTQSSLFCSYPTYSTLLYSILLSHNLPYHILVSYPHLILLCTPPSLQPDILLYCIYCVWPFFQILAPCYCIFN